MKPRPELRHGRSRLSQPRISHSQYRFDRHPPDLSSSEGHRPREKRLGPEEHLEPYARAEARRAPLPDVVLRPIDARAQLHDEPVAHDAFAVRGLETIVVQRHRRFGLTVALDLEVHGA